MSGELGEISRQNPATAEPWVMLQHQGSPLGKGVWEDQAVMLGCAGGSDQTLLYALTGSSTAPSSLSSWRSLHPSAGSLLLH